MDVAFVVEVAFAVDRDHRDAVKRKNAAVDSVVVHQRVDVTAVSVKNEVSDDGNHSVTGRDNVLLALARNEFRTVVQLDPTLSPVVNQGGFDHIGTIQLVRIRVKYNPVEVVDCVYAGEAVFVRTHSHHAKSEASRVLQSFGAADGVRAALHQLVEQLVFFRLACIPSERVDRILVHHGVDRVGDDVENHTVTLIRNVATVSLCPLGLAVKEVAVNTHLLVVVAELLL